ncbi:SH3 domain and tetratricopeptide repeat-containing protein 1 isoform X2 [Gouania willdenowi]|uniref:SH3 domain and tetratricopeptide repeat-containing protein 1 isoform X2 n=1 Tax=Gouania willdenowi TaxID=441366 RepID=UPI0010546A93|nr:SH3 domain and tetratricopeptide repeat-containing protein 1 isoform X2 [Gouania willdenowi]
MSWTVRSGTESPSDGWRQCEGRGPTAVPVLLDVVRGPHRLPADEPTQEVLRGKLRLLQASSAEVDALFTELSAHLVSVSSEDKLIYLTFKCFEEIWKFTTYYSMGVLGHCLENLLLDESFWLRNLKEDVSIQVSIQEEKLNLFYRSILMQEGSLFASCTSNQMFDSSTSGGDLYLEQGDIAQFEPPFLGSGWTVLCLADGARGTAPTPSLEPVVPFHQWFLHTCAEDVLVGDGKPRCAFPLPCAQGICEVIQEYNAEGPHELTLAAGDRIIIVGLLLSCLSWFTGRKEGSGEEGLVQTLLVKPCSDTFQSADSCWEDEEWRSSKEQEDKTISQSIDVLKRISKNEIGRHFKLDEITYSCWGKKEPCHPSNKEETEHNELQRNIERIVGQQTDISSPLNETAEWPAEAKLSPMCVAVRPVMEEDNSTETLVPLFCFLEGRDYKEDFGVMYRQSSELLSTFKGHADEEELISFFSVARETARKRRLFWPHTRLCFLLGKLCMGRSKFSQARVYFEESLCVPCEAFTDLRLLAAIFSSLAAVYSVQKKRESFFSAAQRVAALLLGFPPCIQSVAHPCVLEYILKKAILSHNTKAEAWACFLLMKHHSIWGQDHQALPFLERLLVLWGHAPSVGFLEIGKLYRRLQHPHLSLSSGRKASQHPSASLSPPAGPSVQGQLLIHQLTLCLCQLFEKHNMVPEAILHLHAFIHNASAAPRTPVSALERNSTLIWLAWLHLDQHQPRTALDVLDSVLACMPEHCTSPQEGVVLNMRGIALRCVGDLQRAAESYQAAMDICQEYEDISNWAVAQANLGLLCAKAGARPLALRHLNEAVRLFSELSEEEEEADFITVLLELGQHYVTLQQLDCGKGCYEWALLLALRTNLLEKQLAATRHLCRLYGSQSPDTTMSIIYSHHQVQLLRQTGDREQEGDALEALSQLYLSLGTERAYRAALFYTKTSLGIFIDMGCKKREAHGWLQAGNIYHLLFQTELVDIYIQAAQNVALITGDTHFILKFLEAAGDIFLNSRREQDKALIFYRDRALPIAVTNGCARTRLRLCQKVSEVLLGLGLYGEALEFTQTALEISITIGERLNQRVASHRLASIFHSMEQYELAEHYYLYTLSLCPTPLHFDEETVYYVRVYHTLGDIMFYHVKEPLDAAGYYHLALAAAMDLGNKRSQLQLCTRLATIYHNFLLDPQLSLFFYQRARGLAAELNVRSSSAP